jgi:hypothetical protein
MHQFLLSSNHHQHLFSTIVFGGTFAGVVQAWILTKLSSGYPYPDYGIRSALAGRISLVFSSVDEQVIYVAIIAITETIQKMLAPAITSGALFILSSLLIKPEELNLNIAAVV